MLDFLSLSVHIFSCFLLWIQLVIWTLSILGKLSPINFFTGLIVLWSFACCKKILEPIDKVHSFILCTLTSSSVEGFAALVSPICFFFLISAPNRTSTCDLTHHPTWKCHQAQRPLADVNFSSIYIFLFPILFTCILILVVFTLLVFYSLLV